MTEDFLFENYVKPSRNNKRNQFNDKEPEYKKKNSGLKPNKRNKQSIKQLVAMQQDEYYE